MLRSCLSAVGVIVFAATVSAAPVKIDFGANNSLAGWNGFAPANSAADLLNLVDENSVATGINLITDNVKRFNNTYGGAGVTPTGAAGALFPAGVGADYFFGNSTTEFGTQNPEVLLTFENLNVNFAYTFHFFAARSGSSDNRETLYAVVGTDSGSTALNAANNTTNYVTVASIMPDANGKISITLTEGPNNTNTSSFFYLNGLIMDGVAVPEPAGMGLLVVGSLTLLARRREV